jgi:hypothetical protein
LLGADEGDLGAGLAEGAEEPIASGLTQVPSVTIRPAPARCA